MMKHSAGILVYKKEKNQIQVLLCHMGGPYWKNVDIGGWSIPKGEAYKEKIMQAAIREFYEETGFRIEPTQLKFLGSKKQHTNKLITIFYTNSDFDVTKATSNTFQIEWPKGSGKLQEFPENDKAEWINIEEAKEKILKGQIYFLEKLTKKVTE